MGRYGGRCALAEAAAWWMLLVAGYLMLVSSLSAGEVVLGGLLSAAAAACAVSARRLIGLSLAAPRGWVAALLRLPSAVVADTMLLARLLGSELLRRGSLLGQLRTLELAGQSGEVCEDSWQAVAGLVVSLSPGSFMLDSNSGPPTLLVHALSAQPSAVERSVRR